MQHKTFEATTKKQDGKTYWVASTNHVDREGDTVDPLQMDLSGWVRNGSVLLWGHDYVNMESVIGRAVSVKQTPTELLVVPEWRKPASPTDRMHVALSLIEQGFAKAMSIGFRALEAPTKNSYGGVDYGKIEILEISVTQVPANSFASRNYRGRHAAGPDVRELAGVGMELCLAALNDPGIKRQATEADQLGLINSWVDFATIAIL